jgi:hypothetical protein
VIHLGETTLLVLLPLLAGLTIAGSSLKWLIAAGFARTLRPPSIGFSDPVGRLVLDFALGTTVVPLFYLLSTLVGAHLTTVVALGIFAVLVGVLAFRIARRFRGAIASALDGFRRARWELVALAALGLGALAIRLWPYWSLYVYAGDDIRFYTLITQLVTASGQLPGSYGVFGDPSWVVTVDNHLFFSGSEALYAFVGAWLPVDTAQLVSAGTLIYGAGIPVSIYLLVRTLFPHRSRWLPIFSAFAVGIVASYPLFMTQWGGIDETIAWFLVPVVLALLVLGREGPTWNGPWIVVGGLLIGGLGLITPLGLVYLVAFLAPFLVEVALRHGAVRESFASIGSGLGLGLLILSPALVAAAVTALQTGAALPAGSLGWGTFATSPLLQPGDPSGDLTRLLTLATGWDYAVFVVLLGLAGLVYKARTRWVATLLGWMVVLFVLNENGPFGLYWVQYPGWGAVFPDRTAHLLFLPLAIGVGFVLAPFAEGLFRGGGATPTDPARPPGRSIGRGWRVLPTRPVLCATALAILLVTSGVVVYQTVLVNNETVQFESALTSQDIAGMQWLRTHAAPGSTVLIDEADAGSWVPELSGLRAFPYIELINNASVLGLYATMTSQVPNGTFSMFSYLAATYDLRYVYFGERWAGGLSNPLAAHEFTTNPPAWRYVIQDHLCRKPIAALSVNMYCANDTATFLGPAVLRVLIGAGTLPGENFTVLVPEGANYTYTLAPPSGGGPVTPVFISAVAPAESVFADENVEILEVNPAYMQIVPTLPPATQTS